VTERLLVLKLDVVDCDAEAWLNGIPVARADAGRPRAIVPVHEYALAGANRLELVIWPVQVTLQDAVAPAPPPLPCVANGRLSARVRLLLPRMGNAADETSARTLAQLDWAPAEGLAYDAPFKLSQEATLSVAFPRWRWLDAPPVAVDAALRQQAVTWVQQLAESLSRGETEAFLAATRLRTEELSVAYRRNAADEFQRMRDYLREAFEVRRPAWLPMSADSFVLRSIAGGRLLECLDVGGLPMLRTEPDETGVTLALPLRVAAVEGRFYGLR
jgi:hypothetical protein